MTFSGDNDVVDVVLYDVAGNLLTVSGSQTINLTTQPMITIAGVSGSVIRGIKVDTSGSVFITGSIGLERGTTVAAPLFISGSVGIGGPISAQVSGTVNLDRGNSSALPLFVSGTFSVVTGPVTGTVNLDRGNNSTLPLFVTGSFTTTSGPVTGTVNLDRGNSSALPLFITGTVTTAAATATFPDRLVAAGVSAGGTSSIRVDLSGTQHMTITSPNAVAYGFYAYPTPYGHLRVTDEPSELFNEGFDGTSLDPYKWTTVTTVTNATASQANNSMLLQIGPSGSAEASIVSVPNFGTTNGLGFCVWGCVLNIPTGTYTNCERFWGLGNRVTGVLTGSTPGIQTGIGFLLDATGTMNATILGSTAGNLRVPLTGGPWNDGQDRRFAISFRNDLVSFYIDTVEVPKYIKQFPSILTSSYNTIFQVVSGVGVANTGSLTVRALGIGDSAKSNHTISDPQYPTTQARVKRSGALLTQPVERATAFLACTGTVPGNNKSMLCIHNGTNVVGYGPEKILRIERIKLVNVQNVALVGVACSFELRRTTAAPFAGIQVFPVVADTSASIPTFGVNNLVSYPWNVLTNTGVSESPTLLYRAVWSADEWVVGTLDLEGHDHAFQTSIDMWNTTNGTQAITLRGGQGLNLKCATNTTLGSFDIFATVTFEDPTW